MTFIDIHGYMSGPNHIWHPHLRRLIIRAGHQIVAPQLPGDEHPHNQKWLPIINECVQKAGESEITLIGHSLGTRAILLYLDQFDVQVSRIVLVGPFDNSLDNASFRDGAYANFFDYPVDLEHVKSRVDTITVIGSEDDSRIPFAQAETIARDLDGELHAVPNSDHFLRGTWADVIWELIQR